MAGGPNPQQGGPMLGQQLLLGQGASPYGPSMPEIDFSKIDVKKPGGLQQMLSALQGMYRYQKEAATWPGQEDPYKGGIGGQPQLGQPGVNGIVNIWDPNTAGSNSS